MRKNLSLPGEKKFLFAIFILTTLLVIGGANFYSHRIPRELAIQNPTLAQKKLTSDTKHSKGIPAAPITIVEFSDLECIACAQGHSKLNKVLQNYQDQTITIYRHFPIKSHKNSRFAARATEAAGAQGKFFDMVDLLYSNQNIWTNAKNPTNSFATLADSLNLNIENFMDDLEKDWKNIDTDYNLAKTMNVKLAPTYFINGKMYEGVMSETEIKSAIEQYLVPHEATNTSKTLDQ